MEKGSALELTAVDRAAVVRKRRYRQRAFLWSMSSVPRVGYCGRNRISSSSGVGLARKDLRAYFTNVQSCGLVWICPVCSSRLRLVRSLEVATILSEHLSAGGSASMATFTVPHTQLQSLELVFTAVADAWRKMTMGRPWKDLRKRYGLVHFIRATEVTHGGNGWHPHLHVAMLSDRALTDEEYSSLWQALYGLWKAAVVSAGLGAPSMAHGVDMRPISDVDGISEYLTKLDSAAMELAMSDRKMGKGGNRSPFQILDDVIVDGDAESLVLWHEYERVTKGRRTLVFSRGLKKLYAVEEKSDDEILVEDVNGEVLAVISPAAWGRLLRIEGGPAELLNLVEAGCMGQAQEVIEQLEAEK
jgi:hypothetical protein